VKLLVALQRNPFREEIMPRIELRTMDDQRMKNRISTILSLYENALAHIEEGCPSCFSYATTEVV